MSVNDYCQGLDDGKITVNEDYQRKSGLWSSMARSYFIESILLEYPIPKIYLYSNVDLATRITIKEIVDGQQRSQALQMFYNGKFRLSSKLETEEFRGRNYKQLDGQYQSAFLTYQLPIDQFAAIPDSEVRESFRRMNASNVPLNDEEQRNALFQGPFKWFIQRVGRRHNESLRSLGMFSRRDLIRMVDTRVYAEMIYIIERGFLTTKSTQLNDIYRIYNTTFSSEEKYAELLEYGVSEFIKRDDLHDKAMVRPHNAQMIMLCLIDDHFQLGLVGRASEAAPDVASHLSSRKYAIDELVSSISDPESFPELAGYSAASRSGLNVGLARATRFLYLRQATT